MSNEDQDDDSGAIVITPEPEKIQFTVDWRGAVFGKPVSDDLYERLLADVIPEVKEHGIRFGDDTQGLSPEDIRDVAAYFLLTHGLIEDNARNILEVEFGKKRDKHGNNIDVLEAKGIIPDEFAKAMRQAYEDRKATHHGFEEMLDELFDENLEKKIHRMQYVERLIRNECAKRHSGPIL